MVCLVTPIKVITGYNSKANTESAAPQAEIMSDNDEDRLKLRRLAGGSLIDYPPLFSPDGDILMVIFKNLVHVYSTTTGELLRDLIGASNDLAGLRYELHNTKIVAALSHCGDLMRWNWETGRVEGKSKLPLEDCTIHSFHFVDILSESTSILVTYSSIHNPNIGWTVFNTVNGKRLNVNGNLDLTSRKLQIDVENFYFHYVAVTQGRFLHIFNYKNGNSRRYKNGNNVPFTAVSVHPSEEMIATGDEMGRIFLWHNIYNSKNIVTNLYHWHHTSITSISFTQSGSGFYSSGQESVLVKWNMDRPDLKSFLPRMHAIILYIAVGKENRKVAVCTADNGIQILGAQNQAICILQNLTYINNDKTGLDKFPVGLKFNPRINSLVLNGRAGHLQFYSTHTKRLLYNIDIVMQNQLSMETDKILYKICVTAVSFNIDWMVTAELWNDQEHSPELRLKFWQFNKENQSYTLNSNIEAPHEDGINDIEFSNALETDNLLCATAGQDNFIKIWGLEDSDSIYKKGKVWYCIARTNFKNLMLHCIKFSQDGSLLSAGFGNVLCIYKSETLKLRAVLSTPGSFDGTVQKVQIKIPKESLNGSRKNEVGNRNILLEKLKKVLELFKSCLNGNDEQLIQHIKNRHSSVNQQKSFMPLISFNTKQQEFLFKKIQTLTDLSLFQKIDLFQKLGIYCSVPKESQKQFVGYLTRTILGKNDTECNVVNTVMNINKRHRFKAKYRLHRFLTRKKHFNINDRLEQKLIPAMNLFHLNDDNFESNRQKLGKEKFNNNKFNGFNESDDGFKLKNCTTQNILPPLQSVASIRHVLFATGEYAHLVVICTEHRVLIWNILTLRLQSVLKLSIHKIVVDPLTSLFAAFTANGELYVFLPNAPVPLYHRINVSKIYAAVWVPRLNPKSQSLSLDWQSISTLYFLTEHQELMYLAADDDIGSATSYMFDPQNSMRYSIFGAFATKQVNAQVPYSPQHSTAIGVPGKATLKTLIETATHTMAPTHLLLSNFVKALVATVEQKKDTIDGSVDEIDEEPESDDDSVDDDVKTKLRQIDQHSLESTNTNVNKTEQVQQNEKLRKVLKEQIEITF